MIVLVICLTVITTLFGSFGNVSGNKTDASSYSSRTMLDMYYQEEDEQNIKTDFWDNTTVSLLTISKGDAVYSWFGHSALLFEFENGNSYMFDWGRFSFGSDFYINFAMGRLWYECGYGYTDYELACYEEEGRSVSRVDLNLSAVKKKAIYDYVTLNCTSDYCVYMYHHYNDNCSTRIRDIINIATDGEFEAWAKNQKGLTFRQQTSRILYPSIFWQWLLDFLQSGNIDSANTRWEEMFLPENLENAVLEFSDLGTSKGYIVDCRQKNVKPLNSPDPVSYTGKTVFIGIVLALLSVVLFPRKKLWGAYTFTVDIVFGLLGTLLAFMSLFTSHDVTWFNENLLFINPLLLVFAPCSLKQDRNFRSIAALHGSLLLSLIVLCCLKFAMPNVFNQANWPQIITVGFFYLAQTVINCKSLRYRKLK